MTRRCLASVLGALAAAALLLPGTAFASPTTLTDPGIFTGPGQEFCGVYTGTLVPAETATHSCNLNGFMTGASVDSIPAVVYSTRYDRTTGGPTSTGTEVAFPATGSGLDAGEADQAARVLANYFPNTNPGLAEQYQIAGSQDQMAAAVQAALWHIGDDVDMDLDTEVGDPTVTDFVTFANYLHILDAVADRALPTGVDDLAVHLNGPPAGTPVLDSLFGPFYVETNGASVEVTTDDLRLTDAAGNAISRVFENGDSFWVEVPGLGTYDLDAEVFGIQAAQVQAWHLTTTADELATPMAYASSEPWHLVESGSFTIYEDQAEAADAVATDPAFTG